ncbi:MAG: hypothetical protein OXU39_04440, partial [Gemmatimonadota bacterium]|nr:hypothetical protein [Gemmatimonadota bacterium]
AGFFIRVAFPETVDLLTTLGSTTECLHTHFLDTGDFCDLAGTNDPWALRVVGEDDDANASGTPSDGATSNRKPAESRLRTPGLH